MILCLRLEIHQFDREIRAYQTQINALDRLIGDVNLPKSIDPDVQKLMAERNQRVISMLDFCLLNTLIFINLIFFS